MPEIKDQPGAYGCNMIARFSAMPDIRFDENLPLYGWLEDLDFSARLRTKGRVVEASRCVGVHLGVKNGRSPGRQIGYSHIANPLCHLARKGSNRLAPRAHHGRQGSRCQFGAILRARAVH